MKRKLLLALSAALLSSSLMAGGIMTNSNQSASYARMLARNASLGIDAVYYNPAGLTKLGKGFYLSLNNQSIFQTKDVTNNYPYLHGNPDAKYTGIVKAPVFPGVYAVYKLNKLAFSFGFNPVGGGGGAKYDTGLPSFEMPISDLKPKLGAAFGVTDYSADINFEGTSVFFGYQGGVSYEISPEISVFAGLRFVTAKNTYKGSILNIMIDPTYTAPTVPGSGLTVPAFAGNFIKAQAFGVQMNDYFTKGATYLTGVATYYTGVAAQYTGAAAAAAGLTANNLGSYTLAQAQAAGAITAAQQAQLEGALTAAGQSISTPIAQAQVVYTTVAGQATAGSAQATQGAAQFTGGAAQMTTLAAGTGDVEVDAVQKGTGYTPILGVNLTLAEKLTLAIKYEFQTKIELTNKTKIDGSGMFPDGEKSRSDMPAMLSLGASYPVTSKLTTSLSYILYFDKSANYGKKVGLDYVTNKSLIDKNYFELALGLEYSITDKFLVSGGYLRSQTGVSKEYQSDLSYSLTSNSGAIGGQYKITPGIALNLGALVTKYNKGDRPFTHLPGTATTAGVEKLAKTTWLMSIGLDIKIGK